MAIKLRVRLQFNEHHQTNEQQQQQQTYKNKSQTELPYIPNDDCAVKRYPCLS